MQSLGAQGKFNDVALTDLSAAPCLLSGLPSIVATQAGKPAVIATHRYPSGWIAPAGWVELRRGAPALVVLETNLDCAVAAPSRSGAFPQLDYTTARIGWTGGAVTLRTTSAENPSGLNLLCGLFSSGFIGGSGESGHRSRPPSPVRRFS